MAKKQAKGSDRYLVQVGTGRVFNYTKDLAARGDMKVHRGEPPKEAETRAAAVETTDEETGETAFDVGKATKSQLVRFAKEEFSLELDPKSDLPLLRKLVSDASKKAAADAGEGGNE